MSTLITTILWLFFGFTGYNIVYAIFYKDNLDNLHYQVDIEFFMFTLPLLSLFLGPLTIMILSIIATLVTISYILRKIAK